MRRMAVQQDQLDHCYKYVLSNHTCSWFELIVLEFWAISRSYYHQVSSRAWPKDTTSSYHRPSRTTISFAASSELEVESDFTAIREVTNVLLVHYRFSS